LARYQLGLIDRDELLPALLGSGRCKNWAILGSKRCRLHGGLSTGAKTAEGKQRQAEGRHRWLERLRAEGKKPGPPKGMGGRPLGSPNPSPEIKARRQLEQALMRRAKACALVRHAATCSSDRRRRCREARQEAEPEVQRLLDEHREQRRALGFPPLSSEQQAVVIDGFRQSLIARVPRDPAPDIGVLQDRLRDANDALERARAEVARRNRDVRRRSTVDANRA
jgi:hypothetical protein